MDAKHTDFGGDIPTHYDHGLGPHIFVDYARDLADRVAATRPRRVLEVAAGTGILTRVLRDVLDAECELVATDINPAMLAVARTKFAASDRVVLEPADAQALPFEDGAFDVLACQFGVMFFPDKDLAYREARRALAPGGRYVFSVWGSHDVNPFARVAHRTATSFFPDDPPGFYHVPFSYHDIASITASLRSAGFEEIGSEQRPVASVVHDFGRFAQGLVFGNPLAEEIRARGGVEAETVRAAIEEALREEFGAEPASMPLQAVIVSCRKPA